jgi:type 1 glutamine amidotransferase
MIGLILFLSVSGIALAEPSDEPAVPKILFIAGPCNHPPGTHEAIAGARLMKYCVEHPANCSAAVAEVRSDWPEDRAELKDVSTVVFIGDIFPPERMSDPTKIKSQLAEMMNRGCGIVCIHYATGLRKAHVAENGDHPLLEWLGGYFAAGDCPHHRSTTKVLTATIEPEATDHPLLRGWKRFTFRDEPYWNNYFGKDGLARNVTAIAFSMLPPEAPKKETIAWVIQRPDGGRGVAVVLPHFYRNWQNDDLRTLIMNGIFWSARAEIPPEGIQTTLPELATFNPDGVDPRPRSKR